MEQNSLKEQNPKAGRPKGTRRRGIVILQTERGNDKLVHSGFIYTIRRRNLFNITWRCENRKCPGNMKTPKNYAGSCGADFELARRHNHPPSFQRVLKAKERQFDREEPDGFFRPVVASPGAPLGGQDDGCGDSSTSDNSLSQKNEISSELEELDSLKAMCDLIGRIPPV